MDGLLSNKEADLDDFTKNFIEVIFELKSSIGPFFTKKDVNNYTSLFLEEWIDYHVKLGFNTFYLYDNSKVVKSGGT